MDNYAIAEKIVNTLYPNSYAVREGNFPIVLNILDYETSVTDEEHAVEFSPDELSGD